MREAQDSKQGEKVGDQEPFILCSSAGRRIKKDQRHKQKGTAKTFFQVPTWSGQGWKAVEYSVLPVTMYDRMWVPMSQNRKKKNKKKITKFISSNWNFLRRGQNSRQHFWQKSVSQDRFAWLPLFHILRSRFFSFILSAEHFSSFHLWKLHNGTMELPAPCLCSLQLKSLLSCHIWGFTSYSASSSISHTLCHVC